MWLIAGLGAFVVAAQLVGAWAEEHDTARRERNKRREIADEVPFLDLTGARAFWTDRLNTVGRYHVKVMPKDATFVAVLHELTDDHYLVLCHPQDGLPEMCRVLLWDVDGYEDGDGASENSSN